MKALRTPDSRFDNLADFPFAPNYVEINDLDGGKRQASCLEELPPFQRTFAVVLMSLHPGNIVCTSYSVDYDA